VASVPGGLWLMRRARGDASPRAALSSFAGGALLWTAVSASLYGGWVVGRPLGAAADAPTLLRAADAIAATGYNALLAAALLAAALRVTRDAPNRLGALTFAVFWAVHELAKLNVFLGVVNPGVQFLPPYLAHLARYFGPARNSALLLPSVGVLAIAAAAVARRAAAHAAGGRRVGAALLASVLALAALELALLGTARDLGWWDAFLAWRGPS
jgi:putative photosynthetic complex assembly protein 2